jgi:hypothetical protein
MRDSFGHELPIATACRLSPRAELFQYIGHGLPEAVDSTHDRAMTGPWVSIKCLEISYQSGAQRIKVKVAYEFQKVGILFHDNGFVPILEEVAMPVMPPIEGPGVSGEKRAHDPG